MFDFLKRKLMTTGPPDPTKKTWAALLFQRKRYEYISRVVLKHVGPRAGIVVDVGGGLGPIFRFFEDANINSKMYVDLDLDRNALLSSYAPNRIFCDVNALPLRDLCCDIVIASEILEHLESPRQVCRRVFKIAKNYVVISYPDDWLINRLGFRHLEHRSDINIELIVESARGVFKVVNFEFLYFMIPFSLFDKLNIPVTPRLTKVVSRIHETLINNRITKKLSLVRTFIVLLKRRDQ